MEPNKVLVTGSSELDEQHMYIAQEIGKRLMLETTATLITGGLKCKAKNSGPALDGVVAESACQAIQNDYGTISRRVITMLPESGRDAPEFTRVSLGTVINVPYTDRKSRRYAMVVQSDAVVAIGGNEGTKEVVDLAYIAGKPLILIPSTGGAVSNRWDRYKPELIARLQLSSEEILQLNDTDNLNNGLDACIKILKRVLLPRCFVAMPFSEHPEPNVYETINCIVNKHGYQVIRVDREKFSGSIIEEVWQSIQHCDLAIIDLTLHKPNVYYEMGIAHALKKPTLLLLYSKDGRIPDNIPFDIKVQRILSYGTTQTLVAHLNAQLPEVGNKKSYKC